MQANLKRWLAWLALLALVPLAGCTVEDSDADESTANDEDNGDIVIEEGTTVECAGQTDEDGDEVTGSGQCELQDSG